MTKMKLFVGLFMSLILAVGMTSCGPSNSAELLEQMNKECPKSIGDGITIAKAQVEGDNFFIICELDETAAVNVGMLKMVGSSESAMAEIKKGFLTSDIKDAAEILVNENKGMVLRFQDKGGTDNFDIEFTPDELKEALK